MGFLAFPAADIPLDEGVDEDLKRGSLLVSKGEVMTEAAVETGPPGVGSSVILVVALLVVGLLSTTGTRSVFSKCWLYCKHLKIIKMLNLKNL